MLRFSVVDAGPVEVDVTYALNGGYAGRNTEEVQAHIDELAELGVPGPSTVPTLYPLSSTLVRQDSHVQVLHDRTSGEAEWALVVPHNAAGSDDYLITAACDHTDRALEVHGVAWSKQASPDFVGDVAWRWGDIKDSFDSFSLKAWVSTPEGERLIQDGNPGQLLGVDYWLDKLGAADLLRPGTVFMSGTIPMDPEVNQFASSWRVELSDGAGNASRVSYEVEVLPTAWE